MNDASHNLRGIENAGATTRRVTYSRSVRVTAIFLWLVLTFAAFEIGLRLVVRFLPADYGAAVEALPGSQRIYGLKPNLPLPVFSNSYGFRGVEVSRDKPAGVFRIVMLGDSITFGNSVSWNETFSYFLEQQLNETGGPMRFEVLNLGVSGYNTAQELATLREVGLQFSPDLVVLNICLNDSDPPKVLVRAGLQNKARVTRLADLNARTIVASSYVLTWLQQKTVGLLSNFMGVYRSLNSPRLFLDPRIGEAAWGEMKATMKELAETTRAAGIPFATVVYPYSSQLDVPAEERVPQRDLAAFFRSAGIPSLDAATHYRTGTDMFVDGYIHLSPNGHEIIARAIGGFLREHGWLPAPSGRDEG